MSFNEKWSKDEDRYLIGEIILTDLLNTTRKGTSKRSILIKKIAVNALKEPIFANRLSTDEPIRTVIQHINCMIRVHFKEKEEKKKIS